MYDRTESEYLQGEKLPDGIYGIAVEVLDLSGGSSFDHLFPAGHGFPKVGCPHSHND